LVALKRDLLARELTDRSVVVAGSVGSARSPCANYPEND
jgi:hypothetical protein